MSPRLSSQAKEIIRRKAKEVNPTGFPEELEKALHEHFENFSRESRRNGVIRTPFGPAYKISVGDMDL